MIWVALAALTGLAIGFVLWPLALRARDGSRAGESREADFYRAQIAEIARDVERGQLPPEEAASARAEAGRRLLAASEDATPTAAGALFRRRAAAVAALVAVPAVALAVYAKVGTPDLPDAPLASRAADIKTTEGFQAAVAKIEAHLVKAPEDRRGWEVIAPVYMRMGRFPEAVQAFAQAIKLGDDKPAERADLGEAMVAAADGVVTADARAQFAAAPDEAKAKFYLALAAEQDGKADDAKAAYKALSAEARGDAPWMVGLRNRLAALEGGGAPAAPVARAEAPPNFTPDQRKMIEGMVGGLAERLARNGGSPEEWARLIRAYSVLQEAEKARDALASARKALGPNADIDALARELRL